MLVTRANGRRTLLKILDGLDHQFSELDDGKVACAESVLGSISNGAHGEPHGHVLVGNASYSSEVAGLHGLAVLPETVVVMAQRPVLSVQIYTEGHA